MQQRNHSKSSTANITRTVMVAPALTIDEIEPRVRAIMEEIEYIVTNMHQQLEILDADTVEALLVRKDAFLNRGDEIGNIFAGIPNMSATITECKTTAHEAYDAGITAMNNLSNKLRDKLNEQNNSIQQNTSDSTRSTTPTSSGNDSPSSSSGSDSKSESENKTTSDNNSGPGCCTLM